MPADLDRLIALIERLSRQWGQVGAAMTEEQWTSPTRLDGWDVAALYAHATMWPVAFTEIEKVRVDGPATYLTGAQLLAAMNAPSGLAHEAGPQVAQYARDDAAATSPADLVTRFTDTAPAAVAALRELPADAVVQHAGGATVTLAAACEIALVEGTVHLLDLRAALEGGDASAVPEVPDDAIAATRDVLAAIPDPVAFIEAATGRTTAALLPVLR